MTFSVEASPPDDAPAITATRVVISHGLTSVRDVDRIYVLDHRYIVETGTYDELIGNEGTFAALARRQLVHTGEKNSLDSPTRNRCGSGASCNPRLAGFREAERQVEGRSGDSKQRSQRAVVAGAGEHARTHQ